MMPLTDVHSNVLKVGGKILLWRQQNLLFLQHYTIKFFDWPKRLKRKANSSNHIVDNGKNWKYNLQVN